MQTIFFSFLLVFVISDTLLDFIIAYFHRFIHCQLILKHVKFKMEKY